MASNITCFCTDRRRIIARIFLLRCLGEAIYFIIATKNLCKNNILGKIFALDKLKKYLKSFSLSKLS